jgi:hypothetical protein
LKARSPWPSEVMLPLAQLLFKPPLPRYGVVGVIATVVMIPRMIAPNFGLLDDGVTIHLSSYILQEFKAGNMGVIFRLESDRGRFKPLNFLYYAVPYAIGGPSPFAFFVAQWLSLMVTAIIICRVVEVMTRDRLGGVFSGILYVLSPPVIESYYTLSKSEPPMVLWLVLSLLFLFKSANTLTFNRKRSHALFGVSVFFLFIAYFTKETSHAMLLVSTLWTVHVWWYNRSTHDYYLWEIRYKYLISNVIIVSIYWIIRVLTNTIGVSAGEDSGQYQFNIDTLYASLLGYIGWYLRDFPHILPILLFQAYLTWVKREIKLSWRNIVIYDFIFWVAGWTLVMLPWHSNLEYYLLPATLGISIIAGILLSEVFKQLRNRSRMVRAFAYITLSSIFLTSSICLANGFTNSRIQITVDSVNADLIDYLAEILPDHGVLLVNLPEPNEYVYEIGVHLTVLKQRQDIHVRYFHNVNLSTDTGGVVVMPVMKNQPYLAVRLAAYEEGVKLWRSDLVAKLGHDARLVYQRVEKVPLFMIAVEKTVCPIPLRAHVQDRLYCWVQRPAIETRVFEYGWEVYQIP